MQVVIKVRFRLAIRRDPVPRRFRVFARGRTISMQTEREREKGERRKKRGGTRLPLHVYGICNSSGTLWFERRVSPVLRRAKKRRFRSGALTPRELLRGGDRFDGGLLVPFCFDPRDSRRVHLCEIARDSLSFRDWLDSLMGRMGESTRETFSWDLMAEMKLFKFNSVNYYTYG